MVIDAQTQLRPRLQSTAGVLTSRVSITIERLALIGLQNLTNS